MNECHTHTPVRNVNINEMTDFLEKLIVIKKERNVTVTWSVMMRKLKQQKIEFFSHRLFNFRSLLVHFHVL